MIADSHYFRIVPAAPVPARNADDAPPLAEGADGSVSLDGDVFMLTYFSGEHGGGTRAIAIREADARALRDGEMTADERLIKYHAS